MYIIIIIEPFFLVTPFLLNFIFKLKIALYGLNHSMKGYQKFTLNQHLFH